MKDTTLGRLSGRQLTAAAVAALAAALLAIAFALVGGMATATGSAPVMSIVDPLDRPDPGDDQGDQVIDSGPVYAKTIDELQKDGWTCKWSPVSGGIWTCTKPGQKDFTCSSPTQCEQLMKGRSPRVPGDVHLPGGVNAPAY